MSDPIMPPTEAPAQSSDYFEKIPRWTADGSTKRFDVMADAVSDRIPVVEQVLALAKLTEGDSEQ